MKASVQFASISRRKRILARRAGINSLSATTTCRNSESTWRMPWFRQLMRSKSPDSYATRCSVDYRWTFACRPPTGAPGLAGQGCCCSAYAWRCYSQVGNACAVFCACPSPKPEAVYELARAAESQRVYWHTHETNLIAMKLYDQVAERSGKQI